MSQFGVALYDAEGNMNDVSNILSTLANKWDKLNDTERNALATSIAGVRQRENFLVLMEHYGKAVEYTEDALNSAGTAEEKFGAYSEGIEAKMNKLTALLEGLATKVLDSDAIKDVIDALSGGVEFLTDNLEHFADILKGLMAIGIVKLITKIGSSFGGLVSRTIAIPAAASSAQGALTSLTTHMRANTLTTEAAGVAQTQYATALASVGLSTQNVSAKEAIRQMSLMGVWNSIKNLDAAEKQKIITGLGYSEQVAAQIVGNTNLTASNFLTANSFHALAAGIKAVMMSNPIGMVLTLITLLPMIDMWIGDVTDKTKELREEINEVSQSVSDSKNEMMEAKRAASQAANALEDNLKAIRELEQQGSLTYVEETELLKLKEATAELERQAELMHQEEVVASTDYFNKLESSTEEIQALYTDLSEIMEDPPTYYDDTGSFGSWVAGLIPLVGDYVEMGMRHSELSELGDEWRAEQEAIVEEMNEILKTNPAAILQLDDNILSTLIPDEKERKLALQSALNETEQMYYEIAKMSPEFAKAVFGSEEAWNAELEQMVTMMYESYGKISSGVQREFASAFAITGFPQFKETQEQMRMLAEQGKLTQEALMGVEGWEEYSRLLNLIGIDTETIIRLFTEAANKSQIATNEALTSYEGLRQQLEELHEAYGALNSVITEYNNNGSISYETWETLLEVEDKYLSALIDEEGQIKANNQALLDMMKLRIEAATLKRMETYVDNLLVAAQKGTLEQTLLITDALESDTEARLRNILTIIASNSELAKHSKVIVQNLRAMLQLSSTISLGSDSTKDATDATEDWEKVLDYANTILDEQIEKLEAEQEALEKLTEEKIKAHEAEIKRLEEEKEALEKKNEEKNKELELEELERNLQKAKQRTMRVYHEGKGWVWEQDPEAVQEAQQELDDFHTEQQIENIEDLIEAEEEKIEELEDNLDKEIESYKERIQAIKDYKDEWNKVKKEHEKAQNEIIAKAKLGANAEKEILTGIDGKGGRLKVLNDFKTGYTKALDEVAKEAEAKSKKINTSTSSLLADFEKLLELSAQKGYTESDAYLSNLIKVKGQKSNDTYYQDRWGNYYKASDVTYSGVGVQGPMYYIPKGTQMYVTPYASGTLSAKSGLANVDEKGNELIIPKQGRYRMMEYGDTVVPHNLSQRLFEVASNPLRFIANALNSVKTPNLMSNSNQVSNSSIIHIGTIELPSVTNGENFVRQLQLIAANR